MQQNTFIYHSCDIHQVYETNHSRCTKKNKYQTTIHNFQYDKKKGALRDYQCCRIKHDETESPIHRLLVLKN